jgi:hypothetical protein
MRRAAMSLMAVTVACATSGGVAIGAPNGLGLREATGRVYVANHACNGQAYKPHSITLACGSGSEWITRLRYHSYGAAYARARGRLHYVDCNPTCAGGSVRTVSGQIRLGGIVRCSGVRYYGRATITRPRRQHQTWNIRPFGC